MYNLSGFLLLIILLVQACQQKDEIRPNIVILMADDMGYIDAECYGGPIKTPNINRLANEGMRFTDFYSAAPNCSPARTGLLTGRTPSRVGVYDYLAPNSPMHLPKGEITIAEMLKEVGYETCHVGKWHLSAWTRDGMKGPKPDEQGFDYWFAVDNNAVPSHLNPVNFERNGEKVGPLEGYSCQLVVDEAITWLDDFHKKSNPFFLNVWFNEPHAKIASPPELIKEYEQYGKDAEYLANVANMDKAIGKLLQYLDEKGLSE
ncbi:MAG: sulfatase-like hydrolase/transferase, partial [Cyclobacteriaceae bacterium]|nr:sulfatase-like hydrolase/transferase [Cyclobacteriaceae bacterium]